MRECNRLLLAAGYAPVFGDAPLSAPEQHDTRVAIQRVLEAHEPWPALVADRHWNLVMANQAALILVEGIDEDLMVEPMNVLRVCLHPRGLAPRIANLGAMAHHVLGGLQRQIDGTGDPELAALAAELRGYTNEAEFDDSEGDHGLAVTMELRRDNDTLRFVNMIATFGSAVDATTSELFIETFLPADDATAAALVAAATARSAPASP